MRGVPSVRAKFTQMTLSDLSTLGVEEEERIRKQLAPGTVRRIEDAGALEWIPVALDVELTRAMFLVMGREKARRYFRDNLRQAAEGPILHSFVQAALRLFGMTPAAMVKITPRGWKQLFRDCGEFEAEIPGDGEAILHWRELPPVITDSRPWVDGVVGSFEAMFDICETTGTIDLHRDGIEDGYLKMHYRWG